LYVNYNVGVPKYEVYGRFFVKLTEVESFCIIYQQIEKEKM